MKSAFATVLAGAAALAVAVPAAAAPSPNPAPTPPVPHPAGPKVTYSYIGPSTAPDYHREYSIVVHDSNATVLAGGYGTVDRSEKPTATDSKRLDYPTIRALVQSAGSLPPSATGTPCPGASTYRVKYEIGKAAPRETVAYSCAIGDAGNVEALKRYIAPVESKFDMERLLK